MDLGEPTNAYGVSEADDETYDAPTRAEMARDIAVFQGKLVVDGLRDGMLMPITLAAGVVGLVSKNQRATPMFYDILRFGQRTERSRHRLRKASSPWCRKHTEHRSAFPHRH